MIDFHTHILPGIDDGSQSYEETIELLKEAKNVGFDKIISTSHYVLNFYETPEYKRKEIIDELKQEKNVPEIFLGSEIFLTHNIIELLQEFKPSTINQTNYILIEISPKEQNFNNLKDAVIKLKENNYRIILSHPERYSIFQKNFKLLYDLKKLGVLFQCNYTSILGKYGLFAKLTIKKMLKYNLVNFLGTDVHKKNTVYKNVLKATNKISKYISDEYLQNITTYNAEKVLNGEDI